MDAQIGVRIFGLVFVSLFGVGGLAMLAMATGVLHADTTHGDMMVAWIVGVVFTLIGVTGFVHGVFDLVASRSTHYVLTNRRVMILTGPRSQSFRRAAFEPHEVANGAILFAHGPMGKRGTGFQQRLVGLDNAGHVALQIMGALPPSTPTSAPPALEQRKIRPDFGGDRVAAHLLPGERIVWRQDAPPLILAGRKLLFLPLFAIVSVGAIMPARQLIQAPHPDLGLIAVPALFCVIFGGFSLIGSALLI